jgi:elongation factor P--beta-lysine ligase
MEIATCKKKNLKWVWYKERKERWWLYRHKKKLDEMILTILKNLPTATGVGHIFVA